MARQERRGRICRGGDRPDARRRSQPPAHPSPVVRRDRQPDARGITAGLEPHRPPHAARGRAERPARAHRRRRLRQPEHVRWPDPDPELHPHGRGRRPLQPLPCHRHLLADARGPAHRPQQPRRGLRLGRRVRGRLPRLLRDAAARRRAAAPHPARQRLQHGGIRQVAPDPGRPAGPGRAVRSLAQRVGLRVLLRLPRRRRRPVGHGHRREPEDHRCRSEATATRRDPYYLPDAMADKTIEWLHGVRGQDAAEALLRLLLDRLQPCAAPRRGVLGGQVQGQVRPGLGPAARGDVRPPEGARGHPRRTRS